MTRKLRYRSGDASIVMDDTIGDLVRAAADRGHVIGALEEHLDQVEDVLQAEWPVKSGASLAGFETGVEVRGTEIVAYVRNRVPYVYMVRGRSQGGRPSWNALLRTALLPMNGALVQRAARRWRDAAGRR